MIEAYRGIYGASNLIFKMIILKIGERGVLGAFFPRKVVITSKGSYKPFLDLH